MRQVWVSEGGEGRVFPWLFCICAVASVAPEELLCAGERFMIASMWPGWGSEAWQLKESQGLGWWVSVISARLRLILLWWLMKLCLGWEFFGAVFPKENVSRYSKPKRSYDERSLGMTVSKQLDRFLYCGPSQCMHYPNVCYESSKWCEASQVYLTLELSPYCYHHQWNLIS